MSNYTPKYIDPDTWRVINATIRRYPKMCVELTEGRGNILYGTTPKTLIQGVGHISDPTASKAIKLSSRRRAKMTRECEIIKRCLSLFNGAHQRVICLKFWGVLDVNTAIMVVQDGGMLTGLKYESTLNGVTVVARSSYSIRQAKRIVRAFVVRVGKRIGEI